VVNKKPYAYCSGWRCQAQIARLTERGLTMYTGIEPEFMLLSRRADGSLGGRFHRRSRQACYDYKGLYRSREVLDEMVRGFAPSHRVYQIDHETATASSKSTSRTPMRSSPRITYLRQDGGQRDRPQARHDRDVHAEASRTAPGAVRNFTSQ